jgi:hypothetical protein
MMAPIDQEKIDLVARLGGDWYCRVTADNLFKVAKPVSTIGIGVDAIPYMPSATQKCLQGITLGSWVM